MGRMNTCSTINTTACRCRHGVKSPGHPKSTVKQKLNQGVSKEEKGVERESRRDDITEEASGGTAGMSMAWTSTGLSLAADSLAVAAEGEQATRICKGGRCLPGGDQGETGGGERLATSSSV